MFLTVVAAAAAIAAAAAAAAAATAATAEIAIIAAGSKPEFVGLSNSSSEWSLLIDHCFANNVLAAVEDAGATLALFEYAEEIHEEALTLRRDAAVLLERARDAEAVLSVLKTEAKASCGHNAAAAENQPASASVAVADDDVRTASARPNNTPLLGSVPPDVLGGLKLLFTATGGGTTNCWTNETGWSGGRGDPCVDGWYGVTCDGNGTVQALELNENNLCGSLPQDARVLARLDGLKTLDLSQNKLEGKLPLLLPTTLTELELSRNPAIKGSIPTMYGQLTNLDWFGLNHLPGLQGNIPSQQKGHAIVSCRSPRLGRCTSMREFLVYANQGLVDTELPSQLGLLTNAEYFYLYNNEGIVSKIPTQYGLLSSVVYFAMYPGVRGTIPSQLGRLASMQAMTLQNNTGITGSIPSEIGALTNLQELALSNMAELRGQIPTQLGGLMNAKRVLLYGNPGLSGTLVTQLGNLRNMREVAIHHDTGLKGALPTQMGLLNNLDGLYLLQNPGLNGSLVSQLGRLRRLKGLFMSQNPGFRGTLPAEWGELSALQVLDLHNCTGLAGASIPENWSVDLEGLEKLDLSSIGLAGGLPKTWLGRDFNYSWSHEFRIPLEGGMVFDLQTEARLDPNPILPALRSVNLSHNALTQDASEALHYASTLQSLALLDLSENELKYDIKDKDMYAVAMRNHDPDLGDPQGYVMATFPRIVSIRLDNNRVTRLPSNWKRPSTNATSFGLFTLFDASYNELCGEEPLSDDYGSLRVLDLGNNPEFAPLSSESAPDFMMFDYLTQLPQKGKHCTCFGVSKPGDHNVAWTIDPNYYNFSQCTCDAGFGGERCHCRKCRVGYKSERGSCKPCPGQSHSTEEGSTACTICKLDTCNGHGSCILAAADNEGGEQYECSCDTMYLGSSECDMPVVGIIVALATTFAFVLVVALSLRARRAMLARASRETNKLKFMVDMAKGDVENLKQGWRIREHDLLFDKVVASGAFGLVFRGSWRGQAVAIKELFPLPGDNPADVGLGFDEYEVSVMMRNRHPRLVLFFGCGRRESNGRRFLVMEWMAGGSLYERLGSPSPPSWSWRTQAALDVALACEYLHSTLHVHRDIKSMKPVVFAIVLIRYNRKVTSTIDMDR